MTTYLIIGASRGIGGATAQHLADQGAEILGVSRSPTAVGHWIEADIGTVDGISKVVKAVGDRSLDGLLYLGGVWEKEAFTDEYDLLSRPVEETVQLIAVNLTAPILLAQGLAGNLAKAGSGKIILMGSMSGVQNTASREVANTASKFGLQGVGEALNLSLREHKIATTVINPDNVTTPEVIDDITTGAFGDQVPIPMEDITATIDYVLRVSADTVPSVINLRQTKPEE